MRTLLFLIIAACILTAVPAGAEEPNYYQKGMLYIRSGQYEKAAEELENAGRLQPQNVTVLYQLGLAYYNMEKIDKAVELWSEAAKNLPDGNMMKATLLDIVKRGKERKAHLERKARLEELLSEIPWSVEDGIELAGIYEKDGLHGKSKELYRRLIEARPGDPRAYAGLAAIEWHEGRILKAERNYRLALGLSPDDSVIKAKMQEIRDELEALRNIGYENMVKGSH
ncbi:MAG: tetratricopeptide repeat protein [Deltaproteobacteria bacterium]|nr:tetratricopeptide repeat protein [Deltaproteobacteria bacterium]